MEPKALEPPPYPLPVHGFKARPFGREVYLRFLGVHRYERGHVSDSGYITRDGEPVWTKDIAFPSAFQNSFPLRQPLDKTRRDLSTLDFIHLPAIADHLQSCREPAIFSASPRVLLTVGGLHMSSELGPSLDHVARAAYQAIKAGRSSAEVICVTGISNEARQANVRQLVAELLPKSLASVDCLYMLLAAFNAQYHLRVRIAYNAAGDAMDVSLHPCVLNARGPDEVNAEEVVGAIKRAGLNVGLSEDLKACWTRGADGRLAFDVAAFNVVVGRLPAALRLPRARGVSEKGVVEVLDLCTMMDPAQSKVKGLQPLASALARSFVKAALREAWFEGQPDAQLAQRAAKEPPLNDHASQCADMSAALTKVFTGEDFKTASASVRCKAVKHALAQAGFDVRGSNFLYFKNVDPLDAHRCRYVIGNIGGDALRDPLLLERQQAFLSATLLAEGVVEPTLIVAIDNEREGDLEDPGTDVLHQVSDWGGLFPSLAMLTARRREAAKRAVAAV